MDGVIRIRHTPVTRFHLGRVIQFVGQPRLKRFTHKTRTECSVLPALPTDQHPAAGEVLRISDLDVSDFKPSRRWEFDAVIAINARRCATRPATSLLQPTPSRWRRRVDRRDSGSTIPPSILGSFSISTHQSGSPVNDAENFGGLMTEVHIN